MPNVPVKKGKLVLTQALEVSQWVSESGVRRYCSGYARHSLVCEGCHLISGVILLRCKDCQVILPGVIPKAISECFF